MKKEEQKMTEMYRATFDSGVGRNVLAHMLTELHFFDEIISSEEERALANYARKLLNRMGIWKAANVKEIITAFLRIKG